VRARALRRISLLVDEPGADLDAAAWVVLHADIAPTICGATRADACAHRRDPGGLTRAVTG
jgi:hypothetical protein